MELQTGTIVDRYSIEGLLGQGGMAIVYRVRHQQLGTLHALKVLMLPAQSIRERLLQEGRVQARLRHANIVNVTDLVEVDGAPGLVMEYIPGPSLDELLRQCDLTLDQADWIARGVLDGVAVAHEVGLVHRDLKPGNILLEVMKDSLLPKITDFGLAKLVGDDADGPSKTRSGLAMGTPCYMAPEQIRNAKGVDARADVFSLGAVLYELITGRRAFDGDDTFEIFSAVTSGAYTPIRDLVPDAPDRMVNAVAAALATDRETRVQSVDELAKIWIAGVRAPDPSVAFAPALLQRAAELGSGVDDKPISWSPPSSGSGSPPPKVGLDSNTLDFSIGADDPPSAPSLPSVERTPPPAPTAVQPRPQPRPQAQTASNRDPRVRRAVLIFGGIVSMAFAGVVGLGAIGSGALLLTRGPVDADAIAAADAASGERQAKQATKKVGPSDGGGEAQAPAEEGEAPAQDAPPPPVPTSAPTPRPAPAPAPAPAPDDLRAKPAPVQPPPSPEPERVIEDQVDEGEDEEEDTGSAAPAEGTAEPVDAGPTGRVEVRIALHPMAAGASAIGDVWLVRDGQRHKLPATLPAGEYRIEAAFNRKEPVDVGPFTVAPGGQHQLSCYTSTKNCRS